VKSTLQKRPCCRSLSRISRHSSHSIMTGYVAHQAQQKQYQVRNICSSHSIVTDDSSLLGTLCCLACLNLEGDTTMILRTIRNHFPNNTPSHLGRLRSSVAVTLATGGCSSVCVKMAPHEHKVPCFFMAQCLIKHRNN
jgi:hypothetical protein